MKSTLVAICWLGLVIPAARAEPVDYLRQIKPVLQARCYACHGVLKQEAGLRLDTAELARKGGESGLVIRLGEPTTSPLLQRVMSLDEAERMPPEGEPLTPGEIAALRGWIEAGAMAPPGESPERDPRDHWAFQAPIRVPVPRFQPGARDVPVTDKLPGTEAVFVGKNPIDAFLAVTYQQRGLQPQPAAEKRVWLRRVSLDLIGLPPTPDELAAFLADDSADAINRVVNRLLESPHYGERWGRHWMDIWRYSDWWGLGEDARNSQKHIWHWRDWIVESLNADQGYDQMLREMLAADELYPEDPQRLRAGGYLGRQYFKFNRTSWLDETIEHTAKGMLGLTFNCAKCHDHKYDPFSQADYYRFRALFEPYQLRLDATNGQIDFEKDGIPRPFDCNLEAKTYLHLRGDDRNPDLNQVMEPAFPRFLAIPSPPIKTVSLPAVAIQPGLRLQVVEAYQQQAEQLIVKKHQELAKAKTQLAAGEERDRLEAALTPEERLPRKPDQKPDQKPGEPLVPVEQLKLAVVIAEKGLVWAMAQPDAIRARAAADQARHDPAQGARVAELAKAAARAERIVAAAKADEDLSRAQRDLIQAAMDKKAEAEAKVSTARTALEKGRMAIDEPSESFSSLRGASKALESNLETEDSRLKPFPSTSTGRRTALAHWVTDPGNPLTARVAVNHLWGRHFGRPLVATVFDFGRKGASPTHPELLDWLAVELMGGGPTELPAGKSAEEQPPRRPWRMKHLHRLIVTSNAYRMTSSSAGAAAENLVEDPENRYLWRMNPIRMESQIVRDALLSLAGELDLTMGGPSIPISNETSRRRSLYFVHSNVEHQKFLSMFDDASVLDCYRRSESIIPQQALALENSPLANEMAEKITGRIMAGMTPLDDHEFIQCAFMTVLNVVPSVAEESTVMTAMRDLAAAARLAQRPNPEGDTRVRIVQALLNHHDFVTVR